MTSGAPWSVKGIDPKAREVAKDLARRSGMTLGEWLNRMILEDEGPDEITSQAYFNDRPSRRAADPAATVEAPGHYEPANQAGEDVGRVSIALERLSGRGEARRTPEAAAADSVMREAMVRFEGAVQEARAENNRLAERLRQVEAEASGPRSAEALRSLEAALTKVAGHLHEGEGRTRDTLRAMEQRIDQIIVGGGGDPALLIEEVVNRVEARLTDAESRTSEALVNLGQAFANLDGRVSGADTDLGPQVERRIEALSATLTQRVEDVRAEIAETVRKSDQASSEAIERVGREVLTMADSLNRQVQAAEHRSADAIEQVGGEVARIAQAMEARLGRSEGAHAEALEKLGAEIARITDRLTERIGSSERRAAQAIDDVGEQVTRISDRINQRQERSAEDFAERIRQSEERTARLLDEARETIGRGLADSHRRMSEQALAAAEPRLTRDEHLDAPFGHNPFDTFGASEPTQDALALQAFAATEATAAPFADEDQAEVVSEAEADLDDPFRVAGEPTEFPLAASPPIFDAVDFEAADGLPPIKAAEEAEPVEVTEVATEEEADLAAAEQAVAEDVAAFDPFDDLVPPPPSEAVAEPVEALPSEAEASSEPEQPLSTREVIEQARAAARAASASGKSSAKIEKLPRERGKSLLSGLGLRKRAGGSSLQTALLVAGGSAFLSLGAASYFVADGQPSGDRPQRVADALAVFASDQAGEIQGAEADTTPSLGTPRAAVALSPQPLTSPSTPPASATATAAEAGMLSSLYAQAVSAIEAGDASGLANLRQAANLGHSPAQFYLARLYSEGGAGLKKDPVEARRWTERAAEGGNRAAMHNLGIALADGKGGPQNATLAAQWFRKAADLGLVDSQYNVGVLYEQGRGVSQNAAEAYKWYLIAARSQDPQALANAARVRAGLSPEARSVAERAAQGFRPATLNTSSAAAPATTQTSDLARAQRALSRLGYYQGPTDGVSSPALKMAIAAYQRETGFAATGALDPATLSRLQVFTQ